MKKVLHINTTRHGVSHCPKCFYEIDTGTGINEKPARPTPGAISICLNCLAINCYDENLHIQPLTPEQIKTLEKDPEQWKLIQNIIFHFSQRKK